MSAHSNSIAALFDMDGVIVDTNPYHKRAFKIFLSKYKFYVTDQALKEHVYGKTNAEIFPYLFKDQYTPARGEMWADEKEQIFRNLYKDDAKPLQGLTNFLEALQEHDIPAAVGTSAPIKNLNFIIDGLDLRSYFKAFLHSADVTEGKPNPEIYLKAAERLNIDPANCVVFEDSMAGVKAGLNAGMKVVAVTTTHAEKEFDYADMFIRNFEEITVKKMQSLFG